MELSMQEFQELSKFIYKLCGLDIKEEKHYLVKQRLSHLALSFGSGSFQGLIDKIRTGSDTRLRDQIIEAITTNETFFFRDVHPFDTFRDLILPRLGEIIRQRKASPHQRKGAKVNIWSAASSTGQEPYTLAMLIHEYVTANGHRGITLQDFGILATDISTGVLSKAIAGKYTDMEISRGLSPERRDRHFRKDGNMWAVSEALESMVDFRRVNLTEPFTMLGGFDVIFCRNILIYFDDDTKRRIFLQFHQALPDTGYLMLGACENMNMLSDKFESSRHKDTILYLPKKTPVVAFAQK